MRVVRMATHSGIDGRVSRGGPGQAAGWRGWTPSESGSGSLARSCGTANGRAAKVGRSTHGTAESAYKTARRVAKLVPVLAPMLVSSLRAARVLIDQGR